MRIEHCKLNIEHFLPFEKKLNWLIRYAFTFAFFFSWTGVHAQTPNYVKTDVIFSAADTTDSIQTSTVYSDGLGRQIQTQVQLAASKSLVTGVAFDDAGRPCTTTVPFTINNTNYLSAPVVSTANTNRGNSYSYSVVTFKPDPLNRPDSAGSPDAAYSLAGTHFSRSWYLGTSYPLSGGNNWCDANGFINDNKLDNGTLSACEANGLGISAPTHFLTVSKGPNDSSYSQEIKDLFGRTISTCSMLGIRAEYKYDLLGNLLMENPPAASGGRGVDAAMATLYQYSTKGLLNFKKSPDADTVKYVYDLAGRLRVTQNAKQRASGIWTYTVYLYDSLNRNYAVGINSTQYGFPPDPNSHLNSLFEIFPKIRRVYDDTAQLINVLGISATTMADRYCIIANVKGRLLAEIYYVADYCYPSQPGFFDNVVVTIYSYDDDGNVIYKINRKPRMKDFSTTVFAYDFQGNPLRKVYSGNTRFVPITNNRDRQGRVQQVFSGKQFLSYAYDDYGRLISKKFTDNTAVIDTVGMYYNIRNWPTAIISRNGIFNEDQISYSAAVNSQYNGNICGATYSYTGLPTTVTYNYDLVNRLVRDSSIANANNFKTEHYTYQANGRIATKQRGTENTGVYNYNSGTNQLNSIANHRTKGTVKNYLYDPNGNMVLDQSKKMVAVYDWRDMPVSFKFYNTIPAAAVNTPNAWQNLEQNILANGGVLKGEVKMAYDAGGNRVVKTEYKY